jgi:hypothetical protein
MVKLMHLIPLYTIRLGLFLTLLIATILVIGSPLKLYASQSGVGFYSNNSPPVGMKSLEPLIGKWWNFWVDHPVSYHETWPECVKGDGGTVGNNQSVVFLGDPASAVEKNVNARNQKCTISANQLLYLTVYSGECSEGEFPGYSTADLLKCGQDSNKVMKLMQVKVDGKDVSSNIIRQSTSQPFIWNVPAVNPYELKEPVVGKHQSMAESYYLFFKPMPVGDHTIELEVIRVPLEANQPVEHDVAKWDIKVVP